MTEYKMDLGIVKYHFEVGAGRKIDWYMKRRRKL